MSARRMWDETPYAGSPSYELRWIFLLREPCRISAQVVRPTAGRAPPATAMIASSRPLIWTGSGGGASIASAGVHTSQHSSTAAGADVSPKWLRIAVRRQLVSSTYAQI